MMNAPSSSTRLELGRTLVLALVLGGAMLPGCVIGRGLANGVGYGYSASAGGDRGVGYSLWSDYSGDGPSSATPATPGAVYGAGLTLGGTMRTHRASAVAGPRSLGLRVPGLRRHRTTRP